MSEVTICRRVPDKFGMPFTMAMRRSKNLRAIITHNRVTKSKPIATIVKLANGGACIGLNWPNGDFCNTSFASFTAACEWFAKRAASVEVLPYA